MLLVGSLIPDHPDARLLRSAGRLERSQGPHAAKPHSNADRHPERIGDQGRPAVNDDILALDAVRAEEGGLVHALLIAEAAVDRDAKMLVRCGRAVDGHAGLRMPLVARLASSWMFS